ncbi:valine--tRNA ligase [Wolbachia endosymbiont (group A) of Nomada goodeniana]|uniref:valine--tRNA ligase n=1 Tax=Wolbachia endosymbiont (group A) of Nomada goodeniana TaxID=3066207 RepID=UPI00313326CD
MLKEKYGFKEVEDKCNILWEGSKVYKWNGEKDNTFTIDTPPPTISGKLHIGHIFSYCHTDFIARFQRMLGKDVFYPIGFDDNGLPTERLVEQTYKTRAKEVGREKFIEMCHEVIEKSKQEFKELFKSVGISYDWSLEYHTISKETVTLSQMSFIDLYNKGYAYRKMQPILWDPVDKTAIAQAEIEDKVFESSLNTIVFSTHENEQINIATTRPELLPACVAVFCHPEDARYTHLIGKTAVAPITKEKVPIIADDKVKVDKGTGLVMCCTFGDELDIYWQQKHNLPMKIIIDQDGRMNLHPPHGQKERAWIPVSGHWEDTIGGTGIQEIEEWIPVSGHWEDTIGATRMTGERATQMTKEDVIPPHPGVIPARDAGIYNEINGLKVTAARKRMIEILTEKELLIESTSISHSVKCAERSGAPLEILPTYQWFIKTLEQKAQVLDKVKECNWHPSNMRKRMEVWIEGLNWDWCISRQRYFGVPFPAWYSKRKGEEGKIILAEIKDLPIDPLKDLPKGYSKEEVIPDQDVMDTWATSSITPQLSALAVNSEFSLPNHRYNTIFPADLRSQSHEIIRTWAFYTILKAHYHADSLPWKNIMISGWCLADDKKKMSKSKGNIITPHVILETYGADVVRYWAANSRLGVDTVYSENIFKIGKRLVTKLWNASKFVSMFMEKHQVMSINSAHETIDKWILSKLYKVIERATNNLLQFEYCEALGVIEEFFWKDFCDNYLELVKKRAYGSSEATLSAKQSLAYVLNVILRLFAPFLPYITEEIYHQLYSYNSVHNQSNWPKLEELIYDKYSEEMGDNCVQILNIIRKIKADNNVSVKHLIKKLVIKADLREDKLNQSAQNDLQAVCNAEMIEWMQSELETEDGKYIVNIDLY